MARGARYAGVITLIPLAVLAGCPFGAREFQKFCNVDADCSADNPCTRCDTSAPAMSYKGTCINAAKGSTAAWQTPHDCKRNQCDGAGNIESVADPSDVQPYDNDCVEHGCDDQGHPTTKPSQAGTQCNSGAAGETTSSGLCNTSGACVTCTHDPNSTLTLGCAATEFCFEEKECVSCTNGKVDGHETDVDCGGSDCIARCGDGKACKLASDCFHGHCVSKGSGNICCGSPCSGPCRTCNTGQCLSVPFGTACGAAEICSKTGDCLTKTGEPCTTSEQCLSGYCCLDLGACGGELNKCQKSSLGEPCLADADCVDDKKCKNHVCSQPGP